MTPNRPLHSLTSGTSPKAPPLLPPQFWNVCRQTHTRPTRNIFWVNIRKQRMRSFRRIAPSGNVTMIGYFPECSRYFFEREFLISTSRFGIGQVANSNCTPLGLHRIAQKIGAGYPVGTVFRSRSPVGLTWQGMPQAPIAHRILWLEGLEAGRNRGGDVDTFARYIYIHGLADEPSLGRPASHGCIHLAAQDLMPLFDRVAVGSLVWISEC
jgi:L,D-transpeptidase YbiS